MDNDWNLKGKIFFCSFRNDTWDCVSEMKGNIKFDRLGSSVALSGDGDRVVVGAPNSDVGGLVRVFVFTGGLL